LAGLEFGAGYTWSSEREATLGETLLDGVGRNSRVIMPPRQRVNALIGYSTILRGDIDFRLQLNINNVLDDTEIVGYDLQAPRQYRLTATMKF
jgi:outer membrane receptor protein involved in Fe transport